MSIPDGWVADGVGVRSGDEAFEFFDQFKRCCVDIRTSARRVEGREDG